VDYLGGQLAKCKEYFLNSTEEITYTYNGSTYTNYIGNYWEDYKGSDADKDGIWDTPYYGIDLGADNYPLVVPWENYFPEEKQPPIANFTYSPDNPIVNQLITFNASTSYDSDGTIVKYEWDFGDGNTTNTTDPITTNSYASADNYTVTLTVTDNDGETNTTTKLITVSEKLVFDTGSGTYPSIFGTHNGTITLNQTIIVSKLYTYPCAGTGGHTEFAMIWNDTIGDCAVAEWEGYVGDYHNISFNKTLTLEEGVIFNYTIRTGSYPQIHLLIIIQHPLDS
jgi:PKD repeat protein